MKLLILILITLFLPINITADISLPSEPAASNEQLPSNPHPWPAYTFSDSYNSINIHFPTPPSTTEKNGYTSHFAVNTDAFPLIYHSLTYSNKGEYADPAELFEDYLIDFHNKGLVVVENNIDYFDDLVVIDFFVIDPKLRIVHEEHIVITEDNIYNLSTIHFLNTIGNHLAFISSFELN